MGADVLATQGARASATMIFTLMNWIPIPGSLHVMGKLINSWNLVTHVCANEYGKVAHPWFRKWLVTNPLLEQILTTQITKTVESILIRYRSTAKVSGRYLIDVDPWSAIFG